MPPNISNNCAAAFILAMVGIWRREEIPQCRQSLRVSLNVLFWVFFVSHSHASLKHSQSHLQVADYEAIATAGPTSWMKRVEEW